MQLLALEVPNVHMREQKERKPSKEATALQLFCLVPQDLNGEHECLPEGMKDPAICPSLFAQTSTPVPSRQRINLCVSGNTSNSGNLVTRLLLQCLSPHLWETSPLTSVIIPVSVAQG